MSASYYLPDAQYVAQTFPGLLVEQGLDPLINRFVLTETERGDAWLFVVMNDSVFETLEDYAAAGVVSHLSTALGGQRVVFSTSNGLRYAVLLSPSKDQPAAIPAYQFPDYR